MVECVIAEDEELLRTALAMQSGHQLGFFALLTLVIGRKQASQGKTNAELKHHVFDALNHAATLTREAFNVPSSSRRFGLDRQWPSFGE